MSKLNELAATLSGMENVVPLGAQIGDVVGVSPLDVRIAGGKVALVEGENLSVCYALKPHTVNARMQWEYVDGVDNEFSLLTDEGETHYHGKSSAEIAGVSLRIIPSVSVGDRVFVVPDATSQNWVAVDKVVE